LRVFSCIFWVSQDTQVVYLGMFHREKRNKSGVISVQIVDKSSGKYRVCKTIGSSSDPKRVAELVVEAKTWIGRQMGQLTFDFKNERAIAFQVLEGIQQIRMVGVDLLLGKVFDQIGFNQVPDELFKRLVIARLCFPSSKLRVTDQWAKHEYLQIDVQSIYRYMDKLHKEQIQLVQQISFEHTKQLLGGRIEMVFYDVTTLYFEIEQEDELRKTGFSKEGKHQHPQVLLGLLVSDGGYPLAYQIFPGNRFEGHTMLPMLNDFKQQYQIQHLAVIADAGLMSKENLEELKANNIEYIIGARLKNESLTTQQIALSTTLKNGEVKEVVQQADGARLLLSYSETRAKKDCFNREKGIRKLEQKVRNGKFTKAHLNNRGYNKFLKLEGDMKISIDLGRSEQDAKWDGLKGYWTNTKLSEQEVVENYGHLWRIEHAFRVAKHELRVRPIYHRVQRRIEAHICITFAAYKLYKELERQLKINQMSWSPEKAIDIAKTIYAVRVKLPYSPEVLEQVVMNRPEQQELAAFFGF
jgi:transposase